MADDQQGTHVANGQHIVPPGIAVESFSDNFQEKLLKMTPVAVSELLQSKDLLETYQIMTKKAASGQSQIFSETKLIQVVQEFQPKFAEKGVTLAVCLFASDVGDYRWFWLEFIDQSLFPPSTYKPKYDISDYKVILNGAHAIPPKGVAMEQLSDWSASKLTKECPSDVKELLASKMLIGEYDRMVQTLVESKQTRTSLATWKTREVAKVLHDFQPTFESKGIELVVCKKALSDGWDVVKWIEFIDIELTPEQYYPKYNVDEEYQSERLSQRRTTSLGSSFFGGTEIVREELVTEGIIKVAEDCPADVAMLLEQKEVSDAEYSMLDSAISQCKSMRNFVEVWRLTQQKIIGT